MEKLITYLNECKKTYLTQYDKTTNTFCEDDTEGYYILDLYVISKEYKFIQRLVDNDKVDWEKFREKNGTQGDRCLTKWFQICGEGTIDGEHYSDLESVLMILSIQDNPVEFLIDILK